jgi:hypothetical protein
MAILFDEKFISKNRKKTKKIICFLSIKKEEEEMESILPRGSFLPDKFRRESF